MRGPGRPTGPSPARGKRPWDPHVLRPRDRIALLYVAANPHVERWRIAEHLGISQSHLSILTCCELGRQRLQAYAAAPPERLRPYKLDLGGKSEISE